MRPGETEGVDYYFLSADTFRQKIENKEFLEWEEVYNGSFYGTLYSEVQRIWDKGHHVVFDVDVAGGINIKKKFGDKALSIFVMPPSIEELEKRLVNRKTETPESLHRRLSKARFELSFANQFDQVVVNDQLPVAIEEARKLVENFLEKS
jgi:guanylate kinase